MWPYMYDSLENLREHVENQGLRFTQLREDVAQIILNNKTPISAKEILNKLDTSLHCNNKQTVYSAINFFLKNKTLIKIEVINKYIFKENFNLNYPYLYICLLCNNVTQEKSPKKENISKSIYEFYGTCKSCQTYNS